MADGVVLTLLNGLEHPEVVRDGSATARAPGTISHFQAYAVAPGRIVQETPVPLVTSGVETRPADVARQCALDLAARRAHRGRVADRRARVLWEKAARLAPLAAATVASGLTVGELRTDPTGARGSRRRSRARPARSPSPTASRSTPASQLAIIEAMPAT